MQVPFQAVYMRTQVMCSVIMRHARNTPLYTSDAMSPGPLPLLVEDMGAAPMPPDIGAAFTVADKEPPAFIGPVAFIILLRRSPYSDRNGGGGDGKSTASHSLRAFQPSSLEGV